MFDGNRNAALTLWGSVCEFVREKLSRTVCEDWFENIVPLSLEKDSIILGVSDDFFGDCISDNYGDILEEALRAVAGHPLVYSFEYGHAPLNNAPEEDEPGFTDEPMDVSLTRESLENISQARAAAANCQERHTFKSFVVGEENRYAYTAAQTAASAPGTYNPLYIYGSTGLGKTHLIQAAANDVLASKHDAVVRYTTCEGFLNAYSDSLRNKTHFEFRNFFRKVDLLLVDDVHQLGGKEALQEEFFNTFNTIYNAGKQIILTSDKPPSEIPGLADRLVSRFESGLITQITPPSFETRLSILRQKQESCVLKCSDETLAFIASNITSNVRRLEGALTRLIAHSSAMGGLPITPATAEAMLHDFLSQEAENRKVSIDVIQKTVAERFGLKVNDIIGPKRPKNIAEPRMIAMYLSRKMTNHSQVEIGNAFGGRTHATVIHAEKQVGEWIAGNDEMKRNVEALKRQLQYK